MKVLPGFAICFLFFSGHVLANDYLSAINQAATSSSSSASASAGNSEAATSQTSSKSSSDPRNSQIQSLTAKATDQAFISDASRLDFKDLSDMKTAFKLCKGGSTPICKVVDKVCWSTFAIWKDGKIKGTKCK